jgi:hypothetical protein
MRESQNFTREYFVLRLDISGFFMGIDKSILFNQIILGISKKKWKEILDKDLTKFLIQKIVFQNPLENTHYKSPKNAWDGLPQNKSLKFAKPGCGLPIGNLTSQLFGNIYLNDLDHYIKRELKIRSYGRYVDDMVLVHKNKDVLLESIPKIRRFLKEKLNLELHPKKISLQPAYNGFLFLGAYVLPYRMYPSRRIVKNFKESMRGNYLPKKQKELEKSYLGLFSHFDAYKLSQKIIFNYKPQGATL